MSRFDNFVFKKSMILCGQKAYRSWENAHRKDTCQFIIPVIFLHGPKTAILPEYALVASTDAVDPLFLLHLLTVHDSNYIFGLLIMLQPVELRWWKGTFSALNAVLDVMLAERLPVSCLETANIPPSNAMALHPDSGLFGSPFIRRTLLCQRISNVHLRLTKQLYGSPNVQLVCGEKCFSRTPFLY